MACPKADAICGVAAIFAAHERLGIARVRHSRQRQPWPRGSVGVLDRTLSLTGLADHPIRVDPDRRTCPGAVRPLAATNIQFCQGGPVGPTATRFRQLLPARAHGVILSCGHGSSRNRRQHEAGSIGSSRSLDLVLTAARSFTSSCKAQRLLSGAARMLPRCLRRADIVGRMPSWFRRGYLFCRGGIGRRGLVLRKAVKATLTQLRMGDWAAFSAHSCLPKARIGFEGSIVTLALNDILPCSRATGCRVRRQGGERCQAGS
jgi:hypothetical protein